jgi:transposase
LLFDIFRLFLDTKSYPVVCDFRGAGQSCCITEHCPRVGFRRESYAISGKFYAHAWAALRDLRSSLKHRILAAIDRYGLQVSGISDLFGAKGRVHIDSVLDQLPVHTAEMIHLQLASLDQLEAQMESIEERIAAVLRPSPKSRLLRTVPGLGEILAPLVWLEIGDVRRFPRAENLASYAGLVPRIIASGGRIRHGGTCRNVNQYLKWGLVKAAACAVRLKAYRDSHIGRLYQRLQPDKGHGRAVVAVARHLAEVCFWVLRKQQPYKAPAPNQV